MTNQQMALREAAIGPLVHLLGTWTGDKGSDIAPEATGSDQETLYFETIKIEEVGDLKNAGSQEIGAVRYLQIVKRKSNNEVFHDETGYYMWDKNTGLIMQSLVIPRAVSLLAGGTYQKTNNEHVYTTKSELGHSDWGIVEQPFMQANASTKSFEHQISIQDNRMSYQQTMMVDIYGKSFKHTDSNELIRS